MSKRKLNAEFKANAMNYRVRNGHKALAEVCKDLGVSNLALSR